MRLLLLLMLLWRTRANFYESHGKNSIRIQIENRSSMKKTAENV